MAWPTPVQVTGAAGTSSSATTQAATFSNSTVTGNSIIVCVTGVKTSAYTLLTISDSNSNVYTLAAESHQSAGGLFCAIFYANNITGGASHAVTVTSSA